MSRDLVSFPSDGVDLRARLYPAAPTAARIDPRGPAVVMTHGLSATITGMVAERYAEAIAAAGVTAFLVEHHSFGLSGGEPRRVLNRWRQMRDYQHALDFLAGRADIDPGRLGIWGDSMSGGAALAVASFDERVRAVVVQVPACGSVPAPEDPDGRTFEALRQLYRTGGWRDLEVERMAPMPVVSPDEAVQPSILETLTAWDWFTRYGGAEGTGWVNEASVEVVRAPVPYHVGICVPHLRVPSLWVVAEDDEMPGAEPEIARACFDAAGGEATWLGIDGGHFGLLYDPSPRLEAARRAEAEFLARTL